MSNGGDCRTAPATPGLLNSKASKAFLVALNETFLTKDMKISIAPYMWWTKNRPGKGGGGVAAVVS